MWNKTGKSLIISMIGAPPKLLDFTFKKDREFKGHTDEVSKKKEKRKKKKEKRKKEKRKKKKASSFQ
jgi:hypothetical protein